MTQNGAHASRLTVAGVEYRIRRSFDLICRIEERFGPLREFAERLEQCRFTVRELFDLYRALLHDQQPPVKPEDIQEHVVTIGVAMAVVELHPISTAFFIGEDQYMRRVAEQAARSHPREAPAPGPTMN